MPLVSSIYPDFLFKKSSLFTKNEGALYVEHEISPKLPLFLSNSTYDIIIFDAMLGFLDVGFKRPEAPSDGETERTGTIPRLLIIAIVAIDGLGL